MTKTPIILLAGEAGSGKDTVGNYIANHYRGICLGQADPMKRFCRNVFGFTVDQLWGSTETRNAVVPFNSLQFLGARAAFKEHAGPWIDSVLPAGADPEIALIRLGSWMAAVEDKITNEGGVSPRFVLQTLGTEWGRSISLNMWNDLAVRTSRTLLTGGYGYTREDGLVEMQGTTGFDYAIITDGRFRNEIINTLTVGGVTLNIRRPNQQKVTGGATNHISELELNAIPAHFFTNVLVNGGTLADLYGMAIMTMSANFDDSRNNGLLSNGSLRFL